MKQNITKFGDYLHLEEDWTFTLTGDDRSRKMWCIVNKITTTKYWDVRNTMYHHETRINDRYLDRYGNPHKYDVLVPNTCTVTLSKGTILCVARIYLRKGLTKFDSLTFTINKKLNKGNPFAGCRFFASLDDCSKFEYTLLED